MKQLNLEDFKAKMSTDDNQEVDKLIGGILGCCHERCPRYGCDQGPNPGGTIGG